MSEDYWLQWRSFKLLIFKACISSIIKNSIKTLKHSAILPVTKALNSFRDYLKHFRLKLRFSRGNSFDSVGTVLPVDHGISGHTLLHGALHCLAHVFLSQCQIFTTESNFCTTLALSIGKTVGKTFLLPRIESKTLPDRRCYETLNSFTCVIFFFQSIMRITLIAV